MFIKDLSSQAPMEADWEYMDFSDQFGPQFIPLGDGTYELALVVSWIAASCCLRINFKP